MLWCLARLANGEPSITPALVDRLWDERRGLFLDLARGTMAIRARPRPSDPTTGSRSRPGRPSPRSRSPTCPRRSGTGWSASISWIEKRYWTPVPPPSVSAEEDSFEPRDWQNWLVRRYWRGPTWINSAWLIWLGLRRLGYTEEADHMARTLSGVYEREGSREFYEPFTGEGLGAKEFGWSALIAELADPDPGAANSHL